MISDDDDDDDDDDDVNGVDLRLLPMTSNLFLSSTRCHYRMVLAV